MNNGKFLPCLVLVLGTFLFAGKPATGPLDLCLLLTIKLGRFDLLAVACGDEGLQADVDAERRIAGLWKFRHFLLKDKGHIPMPAGILLERRRLDVAFNGAMQNDGNKADFSAALIFCTPTGLALWIRHFNGEIAP